MAVEQAMPQGMGPATSSILEIDAFDCGFISGLYYQG